MATVNKNFKIKSGLVVEGTTGTINGYNILTESQDGIDFIVDQIGGTATSNAIPNTVVKRDGSANFLANVITASLFNGDVFGNASTATALQNSRMISLTGDVTGAVFFDGSANAQITTTIDGSFATDQEVADAVAQGVTDAQSYADTVAGYAEGNAVATAQNLALYAQGNAEAYADGLAVNYDAVGSAANALADANDYTDTAVNGLSSVYDALGSADTAYNNAIAYAEGYTDNAVASLVDSAPAVLDTLNELAQALQDNPNVIADLQDVAAGKQDTLTAGSNIDITGATISVTGLDTDDVAEGTAQYFTDVRAVSAVIGLNNPDYYSLNEKDGKAGVYKVDVASTLTSLSGSGLSQSPAQDGAIQVDRSVVDGWYDASGAAANAEANANDYTDNAIANLDLTYSTDEVSEGEDNLYFTDVRAKISAADLLTGATLDNITITGDENGLTITAENGVAGSTTDDLAEGEDNLYFTDQRAVDALEAVIPDFTAVEINSVAKQVASTDVVATASQVTAFSWKPSEYRSAKFLVKTSQGSHTELSEVLITLDASDNVAITEYAIVGTNGSLMTVTADVQGPANPMQLARLRVTTLNNDSTVTVVGTLLV